MQKNKTGIGRWLLGCERVGKDSRKNLDVSRKARVSSCYAILILGVFDSFSKELNFLIITKNNIFISSHNLRW